MTISYSIANQDDFEEIIEFSMKAISDSILPKFAENAGVDLADRILNAETTTILARDGDDIVAYTELDLTRRNAVYILGVYVLPSHRRLGIGGKMLRMVKDKFCPKGEGIMVEAYTREGRNFWENYNFKVARYIMEFEE